MESTNILPQGLVLMVVGMTIVYIFLYVMILVMRLTAAVVPRFDHLLPTKAPAQPRAAVPAAKQGSDDTAIAVAIAVTAERQRRA